MEVIIKPTDRPTDRPISYMSYDPEFVVMTGIEHDLARSSVYSDLDNEHRGLIVTEKELSYRYNIS